MKKKLLRFLLIGPIALLLIIGAGWIFENFRGASKWAEAKERAAAMGVSLDWEDYPAPEIAEEHRLMNDRVFKAEWNGEIEPKLGRIYRMDLPEVKSRGVRGASQAKGRPMNYQQFFDEELTEEEAVQKLHQAMVPISQRLTALSETILAHSAQSLVTNQQLLTRSHLINPE